METATVGRKKTKADEANRKAVVLVVRGSPEWREWAERAALHCRMSLSGMADFGITLAAKQQGFAEPPPKR